MVQENDSTTDRIRRLYKEEMLDGQHQTVDISAHARTAQKGRLQKRLEDDLC